MKTVSVFECFDCEKDKRQEVRERKSEREKRESERQREREEGTEKRRKGEKGKDPHTIIRLLW